MTALPEHDQLPIKHLAAVFRSTTSTYKYYWFLALLDVVSEGRTSVPLRSLYVRMVGNSWYTVNYFKLSFGAHDSLHSRIELLLSVEGLEPRAKRVEVEDCLINTQKAASVQALDALGRYVPFRFLTPWMSSANLSDPQVMKQSQDERRGSPYKLFEDHLEVPLDWAAYFMQHASVLRDFCLWNLAQYLQDRNPNVPQIVNKLVQPSIRESLIKQRKLWNAVMDHSEGLRCIYTGKELDAESHIEHFIPHAWVGHDQLWNLVPADPVFNMRKSDRLPILDLHLEPFVNAHWQLLNVVREHDLSSKLLDDYHAVVQLPFREVTNRYLFGDKMRDVMVPLHSLALNNGFSELAS